MTDTEAIAQVNGMATEADTVKTEVEESHTSASTALADLQDSLNLYSNNASRRTAGLNYVLANYGS